MHGTYPALAAVRRAMISLAVALPLTCYGIGVANATVLVPMSDADLVRSSQLIVIGGVRRIETRELRGGQLLTEVTVRVEQTLKGRLRTGKIVVTSPGGEIGDRTAWVYGAPSFATGERVLLFLKRTTEGRLRTNALALGKYHLDAASVAVPLARRTEPRLDVRRLGSFVARLRALAASDVQETMPSGRAASLRDEVVRHMVTDGFAFLGNPPVRWLDGPVTFRVANAEPALGAATTQTMVASALAAWTNVPTASITLGVGPATVPAHSVAGGKCDGVNTIQFDDPFSEVNDMVGCSGVLAVGGFCSSGEQIIVNGTTMHRIVEGDVTINNRVGSCFGATNTAEVLTHEVGHAIGLAHPSQNFNEPNPVLKDATMFFVAHFDGRGASVHADDVAGVSALYPATAAADADHDGIADAADRCPATPAGAIVGTDGCACADAGHASCDDGNACTSDTCNTATAGCVHTALSCSDGNPCTVDGCNAATGCTHGPSTDRDHDGICDAVDDSDGDGLVDLVDRCPKTPGGHAVDRTGCACGEAGHVSCDDGDACTDDACDPATAACVHTPRNCSDGDPCTADTCDPRSGCAHAAQPDTDGDGLCDPIDPCPRVPRGSAFGDRCSCREGKPGRCVPAIGAASRRCAVEWLPMASPPTSLGLPASVIRCKDGNPTCDVDRERGQCTFEVLVCIDNSDPRFPSCGPRVTNAVEVVSADVRRTADRATTANTAALADALDALTGTPDECTAPIPLVVPMRGKRSGGRVFALRAHTSRGMVQSKLRLVCDPAR